MLLNERKIQLDRILVITCVPEFSRGFKIILRVLVKSIASCQQEHPEQKNYCALFHDSLISWLSGGSAMLFPGRASFSSSRSTSLAKLTTLSPSSISKR